MAVINHFIYVEKPYDIHNGLRAYSFYLTKNIRMELTEKYIITNIIGMKARHFRYNLKL